MRNCRREILTQIYATPLAAWPPHLDTLSHRLSQLSPRWQETLTLYEQPPAPVAEFVTSPLYLNLADRVYPVVLRTLEELFSGQYTEAALCWGIGSGKSFLSSLAISYLVHRALCLRDPQSHYGLAPGSIIAFLNMGASAPQAQRVVFSEIRNRIAGSPWFRRFCGDRLKILSGEIRFPKNIVVVTGSSAETAPLGYNLLGAVLDEAAWLTETADGRHDAAEEIYYALQRRIRSRFFDRGLLVLISSPRHAGDFIERKLAEAETNPRLYASRKAIWEVKPPALYCGRWFEHEGLRVPIEYQDDFRRNPQRAMRDLAARATEAYCAYFSDPEVLEACCDLPGEPPLDDRGRWRPDFRAPDRLPRFVHVDLGLKRDACGLAMAHCRPCPERPSEPEVFVDLILRLTPTLSPAGREAESHAVLDSPPSAAVVVPPSPARRGGHGGEADRPPSPRRRGGQGGEAPVAPRASRLAPPELDFARVRDLINDLRRRGFNLAQVSFDGWQSVDSRQILRRQGFRTALVSVDRDLSAYETLKELIHEGRLHLPRHGFLLQELRRLELVRGVKVDHPRGGSKDLADALAAAVSEAIKHWGGGTVGGRVV